MLITYILPITIFILILTGSALLLGEYMAKVFAGESVGWLSPILKPVENGLYKLFGLDPAEEMRWQTFAANFLIFTIVGIALLLLLSRYQFYLPLNPAKFNRLSWDSAFNTAVSFVTNTNWQVYKSEVAMSYLTNMVGLGVQNFLSAAAGISVAIALINSFVRKNSTTIGNFWVYLTRAIVYVLLPLSAILAIFLISQGTIDNLKPYVELQTVEGQKQVIAQGPAASQIAIKHLGTNGGGFFAANSAHPYENPTLLTNYIILLALLVIAAAFPFTFGALIKDRKQGWVIFVAMLLFLVLGMVVVLKSEINSSGLFAKLNLIGGNLEGKEVRFGLASSAIFANATTATATGATNTSLISLMPLTKLVLLFNIMIGEIIFGGVGTGFINMLFYIMLTIYLIALSIGRSPELYGKKLGIYEMLWVVIVLFLPVIVRTILSAIAITWVNVDNLLTNLDLHGLTKILYTYASTIGNNGSSLATFGFGAKFFHLSTALAMLFGRLIVILPALAIAGSLAQKQKTPLITRFPTSNFIFILVLISVIVIVGSLTILPTLVLGPGLEHLVL